MKRGEQFGDSIGIRVFSSNASLGFSSLSLSHSLALALFQISCVYKSAHAIIATPFEMQSSIVDEIYWPFTKLIINKNDNAIIFQVINSLYDDSNSLRSLSLSLGVCVCVCQLQSHFCSYPILRSLFAIRTFCQCVPFL